VTGAVRAYGPPMEVDDHGESPDWRHGPLVWAVSAVLGLFAGAVLTRVLVPVYAPDAVAPVVGLTLTIPFGLLLLSIAVMPFVNARLWHRHFPDFAFGLGGLVAGYYLAGFDQPGYDHGMSYGRATLLHAGLEYYSFIALVGGLYVVSGGILVRLTGRASPLTNTLLLLAGAVAANLVGTTGASVLLIRPFMRLNAGRLRPLHVVFFILIVSNCGGCLTPIGDPPLYLGYLKGVPFAWTLANLWPDWLAVVLPLAVVYFGFDTIVERQRRREGATVEADLSRLPRIGVEGAAGVICLVLMVAGVFIDPLLRAVAGIEGWPVGATFQLAVAATAHRLAPARILEANEFTFFPVKEVGLLFAGIFVTMVPALGYLSAAGPRLGVESATAFYFATGGLSAVLDNAPTYLNFLQIAVAPSDLSREAIATMIASPEGGARLVAISTGAVFFGALTYIGNGPNFMVRAIADAAGVKMPSFFGYIGYAAAILLPILIVHWFILIR